MKRILILSRYGPKGASSRQRVMLHVPALLEAGFDIQVRPMLSDAYLEYLYESGRKSVVEVALGYLRRVRDILASRTFGAVWLEKELFPYLPSWVERSLSVMGTKYIIDYDDAIFHTYDQHRSQVVRFALGQKLAPLVQNAFALTVGNRYLADWATKLGGKRIEYVPTVVDQARYLAPSMPRRNAREFRIGWIGTPVTTKYLWQLQRPLRLLSAKHPIKLVTVGAAPLPGFGVPVEQHDWSASTEALTLAEFDIGVMPLPDSPWERGKCGYKLIQYLACGKPVIASPVGANVDIVSSSVGMLAKSDEEWVAAIEALIVSPELRSRLGSCGRQLVETQYSLSAVGPRVVSLLAEACG